MVVSARRLLSSSRADDRLFKAIADPSRRKMLFLLAEGELPLSGIEWQFNMSRPAVIKHLNVLKGCGLVTVEKQGRQSIHRLQPKPLRAVKDWVSHFEALWDEHLAKLKKQIESDPD
jgi:DNA-binding transcriptional ArsR family regulator